METLSVTLGTPSAVIDPEKALEELRWLGLSMGTDTTRARLCLIHVDGDRAVATDGHRLHFVEGSCLPAGFSITSGDLALALETAKRIPLVRLSLHGGKTLWEFDSSAAEAVLRFAVPTATFPDYRQVIPCQGETMEMASKDLRKPYLNGGAKGGPRDYCVIGKGHFNASYIADALRGAPKRVKVQFGADDTLPVLFRYENRGAVVMPFRK